MIKKLSNKIYQWVFPFTCLLCGIVTKNNKDLCQECLEELPWIRHACIRCAFPLATAPSAQDIQTCGECLKHPPHYDKTFALFQYQKPLDKLIINLKFHHKLLYAKVLGELMAEHLVNFYSNDILPEIIIPVPLHPQRLKERGFNQALELAKPVAKNLKIGIDISHCHRIRMTQPQSLIPAKHRRKNIHNAFVVIKNNFVKHVAILDDVITTGNTIQELSLVLRNCGVQRIDVWSCTKVIKQSNRDNL